MHSVKLPKSGGGPAIADRLLGWWPHLATVSEKPEDAGLIHRLDQGTSGLLIAAKSRRVWLALRQALVAGELSKRYTVVLDGIMHESQTVTNFLGSPYRRGRKVRAYERPAPRTLPATSRFTPIAIDRSANITLAMVEAPTARRHQVRAHAALLGCPLLGDTLYGSTRRLDHVFRTVPPENAAGFCLHAGAISLEHPRTGGTLSFVAPPPEYLAELFTQTALQAEPPRGPLAQGRAMRSQAHSRPGKTSPARTPHSGSTVAPRKRRSRGGSPR